MKRLLRLVLGCCVSITVLLGSVVGIGSAAAHPKIGFITRLGMCEDTPCFLGLVPDKTSFREAYQIVTAQEGAVEFASSAFLLPGLESRLFLLRTNDTIDEVDIALTRDSVVVAGDVIRRLGAPCYTAPIGTTLVAKYQHLAVFFSMEQAGPAWVLKPTSRVIEIRLLGGEARSCLEINNKTIFAWRGFTRYGD